MTLQYTIDQSQVKNTCTIRKFHSADQTPLSSSSHTGTCACCLGGGARSERVESQKYCESFSNDCQQKNSTCH